jgi:hypothetical protein
MHHDQNTIEKLRRALATVQGLHEEFHEPIIDSCRAAGLIPGHFSGGELLHANAASSTEDQKKARIAKLTAAMDSDNPAIRSNATILAGLLRRGGLALADVAGADVIAIDKLFASSSSRLSTSDKIVCKSILFRMGALA